MKRLRAKTWYRYCLYSPVVTVPSFTIAVFGLVGVLHESWAIVGFAILIAFGVSGAMLKILMMLGKVQLVYTASDMESRVLRFAYRCDSESPFKHDRRGVILVDDDDVASVE